MSVESLIIPSWESAAEFLAQPEYNFGLPLAYFAATMAGYAFMKNQSPIVMPQWFKVVYNMCQVMLSMYTGLFGMATVMDFVAHPFGIGLPIVQGIVQSKALHYCICVHFLSKFVDYIDTLLIVIGKKDKQLSVLHVYHHCSISMVWGYLIHSGWADGTVCFGAWINAVIHSIMYTYYGATAAKFNTKPFKMIITTCQLTQFFLCEAHAVSVILFENQIPFNLACLQLAYHCTMIALFGQFFYSTYITKPRKENGKKKD